jgi:hypothetical protein
VEATSKPAARATAPPANPVNATRDFCRCNACGEYAAAQYRASDEMACQPSQCRQSDRGDGQDQATRGGPDGADIAGPHGCAGTENEYWPSIAWAGVQRPD